jgi:hypothetical protein
MWREIARLLVNKSVPLKNGGKVYDACIRPVLLSGSESCGLAGKLEKVLVCCDITMFRCMVGVTWRDSEE